MKKFYLLGIALILGAFLRLWTLSDVPNGLTWDEAAIGYNAYSLLKTGKDEHGSFLPIVFKSFGDYKPGAYIYLTVPSVAIFGLNEFAVRFPSALAGIITILGIYLLTKALLDDAKHSESISQLSALALAISPWHVHFSRGAWEVNVFTASTVFSLYFLIRFIKNRSSIYPFLILACFGLAMYQAAKMLLPLVYILAVSFYWKEFWNNTGKLLKSKNVIFITPFILFGLYIFFGSIFGSAGNRLTTLSIFNYKPEIPTETIQIDNNNQFSLKKFHNQIELSSRLVMSRYLYHFSPEVLFYEGRIITERGHIPSLGVLNPLEIIWLIAGLVWLSQNLKLKFSKFVIGLLLLAPIPASLTLAEFSTVRALFMTIPLAVISGIGLHHIISKIRWFSLPVFAIYSLLVIYTFDVYLLHSQTAFAKEFNYGYKQVVQLIKEHPTKKVVFTDVYGQPYIYYLFHTAYDPAEYQKNNRFIDGGLDVGRVDKIDNVEFHQFSSSDLDKDKDTLFIGSEGNINNTYDIAGDNVDFFKQIETLDKKIIFRVIKTKS